MVKSCKRFIICDGKLLSYCCVGKLQKRYLLVAHKAINKLAKLSVGNAAQVAIRTEEKGK